MRETIEDLQRLTYDPAALQKARLMRGLSQSEAAQQLGIENYKVLGHYETGRSRVPAVIMLRMCRLYNVQPDYFECLTPLPANKLKAA